MRITFLGTASGYPEPHRKCSCTLLEVGGARYVIDAGCDLNAALADRGISHESVRGVFVTHPHNDHMDGVLMFAGLINWKYKNADPVILLPNWESVDRMRDWIELTGSEDSLKFGVVTEGECYRDDRVKITAYPTLHCKDSRAFLVEAEGKRILFTGDLKHPEQDFPEADDLDAVICEGAHFAVTDYELPLSEREIGAIYVNHYTRRNIPLTEELKHLLTPVPVVLTHDGLEIELP